MYRNRKPIKPHTFIYYIDRQRVEIEFSSSSEPYYEVYDLNTSDGDYFRDEADELEETLKTKVINVGDKSLMKLMLKLNKILGVECMGFNHNC